MAYAFGDGFDLYAAVGDAVLGYWDGGTTTQFTIQTGRFTGSRCLQFAVGSGATPNSLIKSSAVNDAIHHFVLAVNQTATLTGSSLGFSITLIDGATNQCSIVFRSDGAMLLASGAPNGTVLATYTGAVSAANTWTAFEIEVVINNTTGSITVRKNGNTSNDFFLGSLNTRASANNYANKIAIGEYASISSFQVDDFLWRSDASSVAWVGDVRCYTRMPASTASAQFTALSPVPQTVAATTSGGVTANTTRYTNAFTALVDGTISTASVSMTAGYTGNMKCAIFAASGLSSPTTVLATATPIANPAIGANTFTFPAPPTVTKGMLYIIGFCPDTTSGTWTMGGSATGLTGSGVTYAAFPGASPVVTAGLNAPACTVNITPTTNNSLVNETQQDGVTTYVYDSNVGDADFYTIAALSGTPSSTVAVTTRGFLQKSDAGTRNGQVQLKSGATTVGSGSVALSTSWGWMWRTDVTDPATGSAWTATGVNNAQIGPQVTA